jgi:hypothetical protein
MTKRTVTFILLTYSASIVGCESERVTEPAVAHGPAAQPPVRDTSVLWAITVKSAAHTLVPGMATELTLVAVDQHGRTLTWPADAVTHSSSDSAVATVDSRGIISALSRGTATISTTLSLNGVTATGLVFIEVIEIRRGRYELAAPVTQSGWGGGVSGGFTALLTVSENSSFGGSDVIGTFENLRINIDGATEQSVRGGVVKIGLDGLSRVTVQLVAGNIVHWEGTLSSADQDGFRGVYAIGDGWAAGPFVGKRVGD